ncbi:MAG: hypothetical protein ACTSW1_08415 [Candidatus Hodarchaeales archaeon]
MGKVNETFKEDDPRVIGETVDISEKSPEVLKFMNGGWTKGNAWENKKG